MSETDWAVVSRKLDEAMQDLVPIELRAKGWRYIDPPTKFSPPRPDRPQDHQPWPPVRP